MVNEWKHNNMTALSSKVIGELWKDAEMKFLRAYNQTMDLTELQGKKSAPNIILTHK